MSDKITTYVLIGHDNKFEDAVYSASPNLVILRPEKYKTMADVAKDIHPPANIVLQAHGTLDGSFIWGEDQEISYVDFLNTLPRSGILSVTLGSCYAGSVQTKQILEAAPPGSIIQSMTGMATVALSASTIKFAAESGQLTRPIDFYLEALDNFNPKYFKEFNEYSNKLNPEDQDISDPNEALPYIMGLGGTPPLMINLNDEMAALNKGFNLEAMNRAAQRVQARFDTQTSYALQNDVSKFDLEKLDKGLGAQAEISLDAQILDVANQIIRGKIPNGDTVESVDAKRIAFAITAAYLDESGLLQGAIERQQNHVPFASLDAMGLKISETALKKPPSNNLTANEQAYIASVEKVLRDKPELKEKINGAVDGLKNSFNQSNGNDALEATSSLALALSAAGLSTKSWTKSSER